MRDFKLTSFALAVALLCVAAPATAQTRVTGGEFRRHTVEDTTLLRRGRIELSLNFAAMYSSNSVTPEGGEAITQKNSYFNPALIAGYMLTDNIELRLSLGAQYIGSSIDGGDFSQETFSGVGTVQALYQRDFVLGLAGYVGLGGGGYFGWRNVPSLTNPGLNVRFNNVGGLGQALIGLLVQPSARLMLRGGVRFDMLFGSETAQDESLMLPAQGTFNVLFLAELSIGWRFG